jgi:hypothetical protein
MSKYPFPITDYEIYKNKLINLKESIEKSKSEITLDKFLHLCTFKTPN